MRKRYEWRRMFLKTEKKLRFQTNTDTCGQGLNVQSEFLQAKVFKPA